MCSTKKRQNLNAAGFSLLEIMVAITILAFISFAVSQATIRTFKVNDGLNDEYDRTMNMNLSLEVFERDYQHLYSPKYQTKKNNDEANDIPAAARPVAIQSEPAYFWSAPVRPDGLRRSRLQGSATKISFITNGHQRFMKDAIESDMLAVVWEIIPDPDKQGTFQLIRSATTNAFIYESNLLEDDIGKPTVVLSNIANGKFEYYREDNKTWEAQWDSESSYLKDSNRFPDLVAIRLELPDPVEEALLIPWEGVFKSNIILNTKEEDPVNAPRQTR